MDNYIALASGQGPEADTQNDCGTINTPFSSNSNIITTGSVGGDSNWTYGQALSLLGANAAAGYHSCNHQRLHLPDARSRLSSTSSTPRA